MTIAFLFTVLFALLLIGTPIGFALGLASVSTIFFFSSDSLASVSLKLFETMQHFTLMASPFFIVASAFLSTGGVARRLIEMAIIESARVAHESCAKVVVDCCPEDRDLAHKINDRIHKKRDALIANLHSLR